MDIFLWKLFLKTLVLPPAGPLILAIVGLAMSARQRLRRTGITLCVLGIALLWLLATPFIADTLVRSAERYPPLDLARPIDAQALVILGAGVRLNAPEYGRSAPGASTLERLVYGARVAHVTNLPMLVSGSHGEAAAMTTSLERDLGITPKWIENHSRDTHQNARMSAAILVPLGIRRIVLVTSSAHMARSVSEFEAAGLEVVPAPAAMWTRRDAGVLLWVPNSDALVRSQRALYEGLGRMVQGARPALTALGMLRREPPVGTASVATVTAHAPAHEHAAPAPLDGGRD
jgi:uncharacterized SAM-binding protein YcdF (DUF218 family)